jgi:hypothetical protein
MSLAKARISIAKTGESALCFCRLFALFFFDHTIDAAFLGGRLKAAVA